MKNDLRVFSGGSNPALAQEICDHIGIPLSPLETSRFSNDNLFVQIKESVREKDVFVVQSFSVHGFFSIPVDHLTAGPTICEYFEDRLDLSRVVVVATDAGGAKRAGRFAKRLDTSMAIIDKRRISDSSVKQGLVVGDVKGYDAIIFDDEISTGGNPGVHDKNPGKGRGKQDLCGGHPPRALRPGIRKPGILIHC